MLHKDEWQHVSTFLTPVDLFQLGNVSRKMHRWSRPWLSRLCLQRLRAVCARLGLQWAPGEAWPAGLALSGSAVFHALVADAGTDWQPKDLDFFTSRLGAATPATATALAVAAVLVTDTVADEDDEDDVDDEEDADDEAAPSAAQAAYAWLAQQRGVYFYTAHEGTTYSEDATALVCDFRAYFAHAPPHASTLSRYTEWMKLQLIMGGVHRPAPEWRYCSEPVFQNMVQLVIMQHAARPRFDFELLENFFDGRVLEVTAPQALARLETRYRWARDVDGRFTTSGTPQWREGVRRVYYTNNTQRLEKYARRGVRALNYEPPPYLRPPEAAASAAATPRAKRKAAALE